MPVAQAVSERKNRTTNKPSVSAESNSSTTLRSPTAAEKAAWGRALRSRSRICNDLIFLDDPIEYPFTNSDRVWVRTQHSNWCSGKVCREDFRVGQTRTKQGFFYRVKFGTKMNVQKYFAPMNGEIKPDNDDVRRLLIQEGWIEDDESDTDSSGDLYNDA